MPGQKQEGLPLMVDSNGGLRARERALPQVQLALVVDDHPLFCEALSMTLKSALGVTEVITAPSLALGIERLGQKPAPDIVFLDLKLPDVDGLDGMIRLRKAAHGIPVVVVSSLSDNGMIASVLQAGASGFIPKHSQREVFVEAFDRIWEGDIFTPEGYIAPERSETSRLADESSAIERLSTLTEQQARILSLVCEGKLNKQIAYELDIAETTVKAHLTAILRKLNVQSRTQAVLVAQNARFASILHRRDKVE
jgi:DNA-binding NarL/FixJ family response regulator